MARQVRLKVACLPLIFRVTVPMESIHHQWKKITELGNHFYETRAQKRINMVGNRILLYFIFMILLILGFTIFNLFNYSEHQIYGPSIAIYLQLEVVIFILIVLTFILRATVASHLLKTCMLVLNLFVGTCYVSLVVLGMGKEYYYFIPLYGLLPLPFFFFNRNEKKMILFCEFIVAAAILFVFWHKKHYPSPLPIPGTMKGLIYLIINTIELSGIIICVYFFWSLSLSFESQLERVAAYDYLTEVYNRRQFIELFEMENKRFQRYGSNLSVLLFDLDHFKRVNDEFGHLVGDSVLKEMAQLVGKQIRPSDYLARWGGEEFIVLFNNTTPEGAEQAAEKIRATVGSFPFTGVGRVTISGGITSLKENESINSAIKRADDALYEAKEKGRNCILTGR